MYAMVSSSSILRMKTALWVVRGIGGAVGWGVLEMVRQIPTIRRMCIHTGFDYEDPQS